jgi:hypothetical protein
MPGTCGCRPDVHLEVAPDWKQSLGQEDVHDALDALVVVSAV